MGIGPSSSHTVGPMRAALQFAQSMDRLGKLPEVDRIAIDLYGSLALTGRGHGTDRAILLGLMGEAPDTVDPSVIDSELAAVRSTGTLYVLDREPIPFTEQECLQFHTDRMYPNSEEITHPNGMRFRAYLADGSTLVDEVFYSVGGGFILSAQEFKAQQNEDTRSTRTVPYPFRSAAELLATARLHRMTIAELLLANEAALISDASIRRPVVNEDVSGMKPVEQVKAGALAIWRAMQACTARGLATEGILPGGLNVRRRAPRLAQRLEEAGARDPLAPMDWVTVYAMAVNEENAAGGRVVTAPTNGAAGVIPAIAHYYMRFIDGADEEGILRYFLTAAAIGILYKENASISGAEVGCQGEVGVACSMAAGGLVAALGGTNEQVEHAAEIAMEHNLGMTCDPIGGLVQIPCIERNGMGAVKAINAARMSIHESGGHKLSLDQVIATMYQTGLDMQSRYKETSLAGLALNNIEC